MNAKTPQLSPQEMADLSTLAFRIAHSDKPGVREHFAMLVNAVDPQVAKGAFGDVMIRRELAAFKKTFEDERQQEKMARVLEENENQKKKVLARYGNSEKVASELDQIRTEFGISDWNGAALIYAGRNPPENPDLKPPPDALDGSTWEFPTVPGPDGQMLKFSDYIKDPRKYSNKTAYSMITDFKRGKLPAAFHT